MNVLNSTEPRITRFCKLLRDIYGEQYVKSMTVSSIEKESLELIDYSQNIAKLIEKSRFDKRNKVCKICEKLFREKKPSITTIYNNRIMEFPSWYPKAPLNFKSTGSAKRIMLIGIDPGPDIRMDIHTAYELGIFELNYDGTYQVKPLESFIKKFDNNEIIKVNKLKHQLKRTKQTLFWKYLTLLFSNDLHFIRDNIYITDACKCLDRRNDEILRQCSSCYLHNEIILINPQLIIIQGGNTYEKLSELYKIEENPVPEQYIISENFPKHGKVHIPLKEIMGKQEDRFRTFNFVKIFHTSGNNRWRWLIHGNKLRSFFKDIIYKRINLIPRKSS
ncbi:hypothetical protein ES705_22048 [subsurface metagenome]